MPLRKHQSEMMEIIGEIISGASSVKTITIIATPGAGKSLLPIIAGNLITAELADALCWVVPRRTLQHQAESNFQDLSFRERLGHELTIRTSTNDTSPCRGLSGFTTTYQAIAVDEKQTVLSEFNAKRYVLILDEFHHVSLNGADTSWHDALKPIVEKAQYLVLMTGTASRGDNEQIAFLPYEKIGDNLSPKMQSDDTTAVIEYTRADALAEKAILPLSFHLSSGSTTWINKDGAFRESDISKATKDIASQALFTAISTGFAEALLDAGIQHWMDTKKRNTGARLMVVTANYKEAKRVVKRLKDNWLNAEIATSHDSVHAQQAIKRFKNGAVDILVAINMVHEGLDVPSATHIICLTNIRSTPWIEQMVARAVRVDPNAGPYESQTAYIFAPDDIYFREIVSKIEQEQKPFIRMHKKSQMGLFDDMGKGEGEGVPNIQIQPLSSSLDGNREIFLGNKEILPDSFVPQTPSEIEASLRDQIEKYVRLYSFNNRYQGGKINAEIKARFEKPRAEMNIQELERTYEYVQKVYPLTVIGRGSGRSRVETRAAAWQE